MSIIHCMADIAKTIFEAQKNRWNVCLYGMGKIGKNCIQDIKRITGLCVTHICDSSDDVINGFSPLENRIISRTDLLNTKERFLVIVTVGSRLEKDVVEGLNDCELLEVITLGDLCSLDSSIDAFFDIHCTKYQKISCDRRSHKVSSCIPVKKRIAVYTCITGGYDTVTEPHFISSDCDYYLVSDTEPSGNMIYKWIDINRIIPSKEYDNKLKNRYCKTHGFSIFPLYDYSIYLDGNIHITQNITSFIEDIGDAGLALHRHTDRDCIYEEAIRIIWAGWADRKTIINQIRDYAKAGMPRNTGLFACGVVVCDHHNNLAKKILQMWFDDYETYKSRDQLSLPYIMWHEEIPMESIGVIANGVDIRNNKNLQFTGGHCVKNN